MRAGQVGLPQGSVAAPQTGALLLRLLFRLFMAGTGAAAAPVPDVSVASAAYGVTTTTTTVYLM